MSTVRLCPLEQRHLEKTLEWANDPELMRLLNRAHTVSREEHEQWFAEIQKREDCCYFAIETVEGKHFGNVWLWDIDSRHRRAELRIVMDLEHAGKGAGTEAISRACDYAFEQLNLNKVYAYVLAINPRARRSFEKAGFALEGTLREDRWTGDIFTDVYLLGRLNHGSDG
ncbi:MAG TPA: GNAT family N-acetyltransferase [Pyrinomonadaceae bacterium]|nr:GNAT family N-acetyltransferase [Pyrinomonadaceae bacterium]